MVEDWIWLRFGFGWSLNLIEIWIWLRFGYGWGLELVDVWIGWFLKLSFYPHNMLIVVLFLINTPGTS